MAKQGKKTKLEADYVRALEAATDMIFEYATHQLDWSWQDLASEAQVNYSTVRRLGERITRFPQWRTFWKLAKACGLEMQFVELRPSRRSRQAV